MSLIEVKHLTKDYGNGKGIFDINLNIEQGEMIGFVGTNGSGKTTTIRNILGFIKPTEGTATVNGMSAWEHSSEILKNIGYVPGEIAFPDLKTGINFLKSQAEFYKIKDMSYANSLIERLQLDPRANLKRMSKGMKQKTALVEALMANHPIIILDEPTTGLDPLMRVTFLDILKEEHAKGKTIFISSHLYEELESTCDKVVLIDHGHIIDIADMHALRNRTIKDFKIEFQSSANYKKFLKEDFNIIRQQEQYNQVTIRIKNSEISNLFKILRAYNVKFISEVPYSLEKHFQEILLQKQGGENNVQ